MVGGGGGALVLLLLSHEGSVVGGGGGALVLLLLSHEGSVVGGGGALLLLLLSHEGGVVSGGALIGVVARVLTVGAIRLLTLPADDGGPLLLTIDAVMAGGAVDVLLRLIVTLVVELERKKLQQIDQNRLKHERYS